MTNVSKARNQWHKGPPTKPGEYEIIYSDGASRVISVKRIDHCAGGFVCLNSGPSIMCDMLAWHRPLADTPAAEWLKAERLDSSCGLVTVKLKDSFVYVTDICFASSEDAVQFCQLGTLRRDIIERFVPLPPDPPAPPKQPEIFQCKERASNCGFPSKYISEPYQAVDWGDGSITVHGKGDSAWTYTTVAEFGKVFERITDEAAT